MEAYGVVIHRDHNITFDVDGLFGNATGSEPILRRTRAETLEHVLSIVRLHGVKEFDILDDRSTDYLGEVYP